MNAVVENKVKLFELASGAERLYRLSYPNRYLVPAEIQEDGEDALFRYDTRELKPVTIIGQAPLSEKLRLLVNVAGLVVLCAEFSFGLSTENLYMDHNLQPLVLMRDLCGENNRHDFLEEYKALAGTILAPRYRFEDYLESGKGLYKKKKTLRAIGQAGSVEEVRELLAEQCQQEAAYMQQRQKLVNRSRYRVMQILLPAALVLLLAAGGIAWYLNYKIVPFQSALLSADHAFLREDYDTAIAALEAIDPMRLPKEERYRLSQAYIISDSLSQAQKRNILTGITMQTEDSLLLYWIQLGRLEYTQAIDTAKRIGDDELLLYALVKYEVAVQTDMQITGEEKANLLSGLAQQIEQLQRKQEEKTQALAETAGDSAQEQDSVPQAADGEDAPASGEAADLTGEVGA